MYEKDSIIDVSVKARTEVKRPVKEDLFGEIKLTTVSQEN